MPTWAWIMIIAAAVLLVVAVAAWVATNAARRRSLQGRFGPEYDRTVSDAPSRREAEAELRERERRRDELEIRALSAGDRRSYLREWERVQADFVDDPGTAVSEADTLIQRVMRDRGYPVEDFEQRAADLSVDHADVLDHYRTGHAIARKHVRDEADTEELRQGLVHYRALFDALLAEEPARAEQT
jgi:hypothetical protein